MAVEGRVYYRGPRRAGGDLPRVKIDLTADEVLVDSPMLRGIAHPYIDEFPDPPRVTVYSLPEIFGEKLRALAERCLPRDLYDVINLYRGVDLRGASGTATRQGSTVAETARRRSRAAKADRSDAALGELSLVTRVRNTEDEKGKTVLVTGGNRGIGEQVCRELARAGWDILLAARDPSTGEAVAAQLRQETGGRVEVVSLDVTSPDLIADLVRRLQQDAIRLDALVNNAGVYGERRGSEGTRRTLETNFFGPLRLTEALLPVLNDGATITNVTSGLGALANLSDLRRRQLADPGLTRERLVALMEECVETAAKGWGTDAYGVSKAALNALTRTLARELAPRRIRVNSTCPGWVRTDMGGRDAPRSVEEGAASVLFGVTLPEDGPTGRVFRDGREIAP